VGFNEDYFASECQQTRCVNRRTTLVETGDDLRRSQALLRQIMERAKRDEGPLGREIYRAIALFNLGELDPERPIFR